MPSENPNSKPKCPAKKGSLKRRLSGLFLLHNEPKPTKNDAPKIEAPIGIVDGVTRAPPRKLFSLPSYLKRGSTRGFLPEGSVDLKEPTVANEVTIMESIYVEPHVAATEYSTPAPQLAYKISLQKLQEPSRRPLIQVFLIQRLITKATLKLKSEGIAPRQLMQERRYHARDSSLLVRRRSCPTIQQRVPPPPYSSTRGILDKEDDVPLGLLQKEYLNPTTVSVLVV
ncbi:hypothetical protein K493DRAFT_378320 [Basidiobolus meristosporus CBS 931.73]|uniref:Uncharacterized protein n=1 Tax=Basidiobolus meristosporus CBS 931.73 TaxID=1314790 RepID=A0A1Y1Y0X0_9FUNG|nr:hypothetical protein K493DRAFT_378320 [Basidiobolus meristosporus CBS 931.73]|eukprot:ORX91662.1 hypothetical protein K493DRAFT_378320 [Basidiobolus meristosporus CBS 931.73]